MSKVWLRMHLTCDKIMTDRCKGCPLYLCLYVDWVVVLAGNVGVKL